MRLELYRARHLVADLVESARGGHFDHLGKTAAELRSLLPAPGG